MAVRTPLRMTTSLASLMMCLLEKDLHYPAIPGASHRRWLALDQTPVTPTGFRDATRAGREGDERHGELARGSSPAVTRGCKTTRAVEGISARGCWRRRA